METIIAQILGREPARSVRVVRARSGLVKRPSHSFALRAGRVQRFASACHVVEEEFVSVRAHPRVQTKHALAVSSGVGMLVRSFRQAWYAKRGGHSRARLEARVPRRRAQPYSAVPTHCRTQPHPAHILATDVRPCAPSQGMRPRPHAPYAYAKPSTTPQKARDDRIRRQVC